MNLLTYKVGANIVFVRYIWNSEPYEDMLLGEPIS